VKSRKGEYGGFLLGVQIETIAMLSKEIISQIQKYQMNQCKLMLS
jgi:DNA-binding IscR family transcriptional regulator